MTKFYTYKRFFNRIKQDGVCFHSNNYFRAIEISTNPVSFTVFVNQILFSGHSLCLHYLQLCHQNTAIIPQNLVFKQKKGNVNEEPLPNDL